MRGLCGRGPGARGDCTQCTGERSLWPGIRITRRLYRCTGERSLWPRIRRKKLMGGIHYAKVEVKHDKLKLNRMKETL